MCRGRLLYSCAGHNQWGRLPLLLQSAAVNHQSEAHNCDDKRRPDKYEGDADVKHFAGRRERQYGYTYQTVQHFIRECRMPTLTFIAE